MAGFARFVGAPRRHTDSSGEPRLPKGAEAALWSILEVATAVDVPEVDVRDVDVRDVDVRVLDVRDVGVPDVDVRTVDDSPAIDPYYDLGAIEENPRLTSHLFMQR